MRKRTGEGEAPDCSVPICISTKILITHQKAAWWFSQVFFMEISNCKRSFEGMDVCSVLVAQGSLIIKISSNNVGTYLLIVQGNKSELKQHLKDWTVSKWEAGKWSCPVGIFALTQYFLWQRCFWKWDLMLHLLNTVYISEVGILLERCRCINGERRMHLGNKLHLPKYLRKTLLGSVFNTLTFYFLTIPSFSGDTFS